MDRIKRLLDELIDNLQSQEELNRLGLAGQRKIKSRTRKGRDVQGRPFEPYSDAHAARREALGLPTDVVNLEMNDIDGMLQKMDQVVASNLESVHIDITDPEKRKIASYHNELGVGRPGAHIRRFWGISEQEEKDLTDLVAKDVDALLAKLARKYSD